MSRKTWLAELHKESLFCWNTGEALSDTLEKLECAHLAQGPTLHEVGKVCTLQFPHSIKLTLGAVGNMHFFFSMLQWNKYPRICTFLVLIGLRFNSDIRAKKWQVKPLLSSQNWRTFIDVSVGQISGEVFRSTRASDSGWTTFCEPDRADRRSDSEHQATM